MRRYGTWAGDPEGQPEDPALCVAEVQSWPLHVYSQCARKRGHGNAGLFCKQHAKMDPARLTIPKDFSVQPESEER